LATLYFSYSITAFLSSALVEKIGLYKVLVIGSFFHFTFVLVSILPAFHFDYPNNDSWLVSTSTIKTFLIIAALLNGFGAGILWCAMGTYMADCAT
jgi:MFS family permease